MSISISASTKLLDSLITPDILADRLGVTTRCLAEWRVRGQGPKYIRTGRSPRYRPEAVDAWLLGQEHQGTAEESR